MKVGFVPLDLSIYQFKSIQELQEPLIVSKKELASPEGESMANKFLFTGCGS